MWESIAQWLDAQWNHAGNMDEARADDATNGTTPPVEDGGMSVEPNAGTDAASSSGSSSSIPSPSSGSSSSSSGYTPSRGSQFAALVIMWLAAVLRHLITPQLWLAFLPGRYLAFIAGRYAQESAWGTIRAEATSGGGEGLLYFNQDNRYTYGVTPGSAWSEGWAVPAYLRDGIESPKAWLYYLIPGPTYLGAVWRSHSAFYSEATLAAAVALVRAESKYARTYWTFRAIGILADVPYVIGIAALVAIIVRRRRAKRAGK